MIVWSKDEAQRKQQGEQKNSVEDIEKKIQEENNKT